MEDHLVNIESGNDMEKEVVGAALLWISNSAFAAKVPITCGTPSLVPKKGFSFNLWYGPSTAGAAAMPMYSEGGLFESFLRNTEEAE